MSIYVITDDLTGANDTAVQFAKKGLRTVVFLDPINASRLKEQIEVIVLNTDSRALPVPSALMRIQSAFHSISPSETDILFKKIDSTLRGNVVPEVEEALTLSKKEIAIVAPAYPKNKRTTVYGIHYVRGIPVAETEAASDPRCPVRHSHIPTLFQTQGSFPTASIPLDQIRGSSLKERVTSLAERGSRILIFDAETDQDLQSIVQGVLSSGLKSLWVGSAGLAEALSEEYLTARLNSSSPPLSFLKQNLSPLSKPVLIILGSMSEVSTQQAEIFARWAGIEPYTLDPSEILKGNSKGIETSLTWIHTSLKEGNHTLLMSDRHKVPLFSTGSSDPIETLLHAFQDLGASIDFSLCSGLIVTGGDIAMAVCKGMGVQSIEVIDETSPGIPLGFVRGGRWEGLPLVTKAGAFGSSDAFILAGRRISSIPGKEKLSWNK
ncbi:MAG: four-carbon acid sugar kinase family protein [Spirochaetes bacterium]|nr:four-carbon acid sugar kinase family protein [Spirochaetota bacterium]